MRKRGILSFLIGLMFLVFALVQYNDPDPWAWVIMYGIISFIAIFSAFGIYSKWVTYAALSISLMWMIMLSPGLWQWLRYEPFDALIYGMAPDKMYIEESREFLRIVDGSNSSFFCDKTKQGEV